MAATTVVKIALTAKLDNGTTTTGAVRTVSVGLGDIDEDNFDVNKAEAIGQKLAPCLSKSIYRLEQVTTSAITAE